jgi:mono/diheme cytochrome c family protein
VSALLLALLMLPGSAMAASMGDARLDYVLNCAGCHGLDGRGVPDKGVPRLQGTVGKLLHAPDGRAFVVQAPGVANAALSDTELARLLNWLLPEMDAAHLPAGAAPYTAEEVGAYRRAGRTEYLARRAALAAALAAQGIALDDYGS